MFALTLVFYLFATGVSGEREDRQFSLFNVIKFPNDLCLGSGSLNGTCYTATECTSLGGTSSGTCASGFGVCCVFSLACGGSTSANTSYAIINSFNTATDTDPCIYKFCKNNDDVCKLRIDYETMVLTSPTTDATAYNNGGNFGRCDTDTLTVLVPGSVSPPVICGYNTGQHMWVPASDSCVTLNINIDTASTATTRSWTISVTQYECGNLMAPEENCLQYHTATTGTIASFNWDTSKTSNLKTELITQSHLADQYYDICIRRTRGYCAVCYSPQIIHTVPTAIATEGSSFGVSAASAPAPTISIANGAACTGITTSHATAASAVGFGDYITIDNAQDGVGTAATQGTDKLCGILFNASPTATESDTATVCSYVTPFRVGVHFDSSEAIGAPPTVAAADNYNAIENAAQGPGTTSNGAGTGTNGFWLAYWQNTC